MSDTMSEKPDLKEYKMLSQPDTPGGRRKLAEEMTALASEGWVVLDKDQTARKALSGTKAIVGTIATLPLGGIGILAGLNGKKGRYNVTLERKVDPNRPHLTKFQRSMERNRQSREKNQQQWAEIKEAWRNMFKRKR